MIEIELPGRNHEARIDWAGERYADLCEGELLAEQGWFVWGVIVGWTDSASPDEKRQYNALAQLFSDLLWATEEGD